MNKCACGNTARLNETQCGRCEAEDNRVAYIETHLDNCQTVEELKQFIRDHLVSLIQ